MSFKILGIRFSERRIRLRNKIYKISVKKQLFAFVFGIIFCIIAGLVINRKDTISPTPSVQPTTTPEISKSTIAIVTPGEIMIIVHVSGAVSVPGIVSVSQNSRIADVVKAAGGFTKDCDLSEINLAAFASDGMKIHIPHIGETPKIISPSPTVLTNSSERTASRTGPYEKININTATIPQLTQLNGIGESIAEKIIAYREEHGFFTKTEDILLVSGIGTNKYNAIKDYICI